MSRRHIAAVLPPLASGVAARAADRTPALRWQIGPYRMTLERVADGVMPAVAALNGLPALKPAPSCQPN